MSGENLLTRALSLSNEQSQVSTDELKPFSGHIARLSKFYRQLECDLEHRYDWHTAGDNASAAGTEGEGKDCKATRLRNDLRDILRCSIKNIPSINEAVWNFKQPTESDTCLKARTVHLQDIPTLQKRRFSIAAASPERILMLCACASLAEDFYHFELQSGWQPKQTIVMERIRNKQDIAVQQMGKNLHRYTASQSTVLPSVRHKLEAALRVGIKLATVREIGSEMSVPCLSLLLGFAFDKMSRVSFSSLRYLQEELEAQPDTLQAARDFGSLLCSWWPTCQDEYHARFRDSTADTPNLSTAIPHNLREASTLPQLGPFKDISCNPDQPDTVVEDIPTALPYPLATPQWDWEYDWTPEQMIEWEKILSMNSTTASNHSFRPTGPLFDVPPG